MNNLEQDEELARLSVPQLIEKISELTTQYNASLKRLTYEILIRAMQEAK